MSFRVPVTALTSGAFLVLFSACGSDVEPDGLPAFGGPPPGASTDPGTNDAADQSQQEPGNADESSSPGSPMSEDTTPANLDNQQPGATPVELHGQLRVEGTDLVDQNGEPFQLEGISSMWLNWEDRFSQSKEGLQWMRDNWNITLYRVAVGVEPNNAYLSQPDRMMALTRTAVQNAIDLGLYVIIDWHAHEAHESPEAAEEFFRQMAQEYGQYPNVLYETFNEPLGDHQWSNTIKPYHERIIPVIREQDPDGVIILGNRQWDQRPDEAASDPVAGDNLMYAVHFYACDHRANIRQNAQRAYDAGLALFVSEWGATPADGGADNPIVCTDSAQEWFDWMDERNIGSAAWKFDTCGDSSCFFNRQDVPIDGGWTDEWLTDHSRFIRDRLLD